MQKLKSKSMKKTLFLKSSDSSIEAVHVKKILPVQKKKVKAKKDINDIKNNFKKSAFYVLLATFI